MDLSHELVPVERVHGDESEEVLSSLGTTSNRVHEAVENHDLSCRGSQ
jgi:hypothetical protein